MSKQLVGSPLSMHDPPTVGPWTLESRLGAGGMGVVFYGHAPGRDPAAIKVIRPGLLDAPATRDRFRREVAILQSVRDRHISEFLEADLESDPAWLAIEYISGPVLRDEVLENGPLAEDRWWDVTRGLAQALAVLDVHRITHRDLKPGNVILNERGPVVIDFGIAHPEDATALTATGLVTGSPAWLSPEQANLEPTGPPSDVFTLGSLLAFAATGRPPFGEGASVAVLVSITTKEPDLEGVDPARTALLRRMLAKNQTARPTARQILDLARARDTGELRAAKSPLLTDPGPTRKKPAAPEGPSDSTKPDGIEPVEVAAISAAGAGRTPQPAGSGGAPADPPAQPVDPPATATASVDPPVAHPVEPPAPGPRPQQVVQPSTAAGVPAAAAVSGAQPLAQPPTAAPTTGTVIKKRPPILRWILILAVVVAVALGAWWGIGLISGGQYGGTPSGSSSAPPSARRAPAAPASDVLVSDNWLLASYRFSNVGTDMTVSGTVTNRASAPASADLTLWVYLADGTSLGSVNTTVQDVPGGGSVNVTMTGDAVWKPGAKVVLLEAS